MIVGEHHPYGFGGKEEQSEFGMNWVDITARNYDPAIGRWMNLDPLAEKMRRHSPYIFGFNNPIYFQDYDGMMPSGPGDPPSIWQRIKNKTKSFLAKNDIIFDFKSTSSARVGFSGGFSLGKNGENPLKATIDVKLVELEMLKIEGSLTESNSVSYDHFGKNGETKIKTGVEVSFENENTKLTVIEAHNNFTSVSSKTSSKNTIRDKDSNFDNPTFFESSEMSSTMESNNYEDFAQKTEDSNGNSVSNKSSSKTEGKVSVNAKKQWRKNT